MTLQLTPFLSEESAQRHLVHKYNIINIVSVSNQIKRLDIFHPSV